MARRLAAIMFTDIAGYTSLSQTDEPGALRLLQDQERLVRGLLEIHRGRLVKSMGDGLLIEFANALDAVECAVDLQRHIHQRNAREPSPELRVRIGIHLGDVEGAGSDILGDAVNISSRVEPLAQPGGVCVTEQVFAQVHSKVPYALENLGPRTLKGVQEPVGVYRLMFPAPEAESAVGDPSLPRVAVLPFANISPDPKDEYFADGLTEELISILSQVGGLRVIARTSVSQYKATPKPISQIGNELGVSAVLEGSVRKADSQLRITAQLIDVRTEEHRWAQTFDRKLENVFAIQAEVAERTATALKVELLRSEREAIQERPTSNLAAYEAYLRGIQAGRLLSGVRSLKITQEVSAHFEAAIRLDPEFSGSYAYLANCLLGIMGLARSAKETVPRARECAAKALELNPRSSEAHTAQGNVAFQADLDWGRAETEFQQAISLNPSSSTAHFWYAYLIAALQRFKESAKHYRAASELDPLWLVPRFNLAWNCVESGDLPAATEAFQQLAEGHPDELAISDALAVCYALNGREEQALRLIGPDRVASSPTGRAVRADVLAYLGQPQELLAFLADYEAGRIEWYISEAEAALSYALLGKQERALALLEKDMRDGDKVLWNFYQSPALDSVRDDPRFLTLLRSANLPTTLSRPRRAPPRRPNG